MSKCIRCNSDNVLHFGDFVEEDLYLDSDANILVSYYQCDDCGADYEVTSLHAEGGK